MSSGNGGRKRVVSGRGWCKWRPIFGPHPFAVAKVSIPKERDRINVKERKCREYTVVITAQGTTD